MPEHLSKYAAKVERRRTAQTLSAIALAVRITEKEIEPPKASKGLTPGNLPTPRMPHPTPPRKKHELADIDALKRDCADALKQAANLLSCAKEYAAQMVNASASGLQAAEPRGIWQFCMSIGLKVEGMAKRAEAVPSRKAAQ